MARRSSTAVSAIVMSSLIVTATGMEAQPRDTITSAGSIARHPAASAAAAPLGSNAAATTPQLLDRLARDAWDTFSARIAVRRESVTADGTPVGLAPATTEYIWERSRTASGWKTTITMVVAPAVKVQTLNGVVTLPEAPTVVKMVDPGDGSAPRFWAMNGAEIKMPSPAAQAAVMGSQATGVGASMAEGILHGVSGITAPPSGQTTGWIDAFIMPAAKRTQRLSAFERQFGRPRGIVRGLSRYFRQQPDGDREVLVDEQAGVPVESNLVVNGALVAHSTFAYERAASGALVRRGVRSERVVSGGDGTRTVTEVSFSDIAVEQRGGRR